MGVVVSRFWGTHAIAYEGDSATGLTSTDKYLLAETFQFLKQDISGSGHRLFILYFQDYPDNKSYFRDFQNKTLEELETSPKLTAHGTNVMCSLNSMIANLNDPQVLVEVIKKVGYNHAKRKISIQSLLELKATILKLLQEKLKQKYTVNVEEVWSKTIDVIAATFQSGAQEYWNEHNHEEESKSKF